MEMDRMKPGWYLLFMDSAQIAMVVQQNPGIGDLD